ncbi:PAS domain-containing protein [Methylorubrum thiocyanatum]
MPYHSRQFWLDFLPDALIASQIGIWETDFENDRTVADATTAALFGVDPVQAALGLPLAAYAEAIFPDDQAGFFSNIDRVCEQGGLFVVEYRVRSAVNGVRWVLARGHYQRDERTGGVLGRGIVVDITESKRSGQADDRRFLVLQERDETPLDRIATCALQARGAINDVAEHEKPALQSAVDGLLWAVGRALAKRNLF